jgi:hypothetical protein
VGRCDFVPPLPAILTGNGASIAVWSKFAYSSLYKTATSWDIQHPLCPYCQEHFKASDTTDFEKVQRSLKEAEEVLKRLPGVSQYFGAMNEIRRQYDMIRQALSESVKAVHIPFDLSRLLWTLG